MLDANRGLFERGVVLEDRNATTHGFEGHSTLQRRLGDPVRALLARWDVARRKHAPVRYKPNRVAIVARSLGVLGVR